MFPTRPILVSVVRGAGLACAVVMLAGCGQRGPLYLPTDPAAAGRATLPELLDPRGPRPAPAVTADPQPSGGLGRGTAAPVGGAP